MNRTSKLLVAAALVLATAPALLAQPAGVGRGGPALVTPGGPVLVTPDGTALVLRPTATQGSHDLVAIKRDGTTLWTTSITGGVHGLAQAGNLLIVAVATTSGSGTALTVSGALSALQLANGTQAWKTAVDGVPSGLEVASEQIYVTVVKMVPGTGQAGTGGTGGQGGHGGMGGQGGQGGQGGMGGQGGPGGPATGSHDRSLAAFGLDGKALWSVSLSS